MDGDYGHGAIRCSSKQQEIAKPENYLAISIGVKSCMISLPKKHWGTRPICDLTMQRKSCLPMWEQIWSGGDFYFWAAYSISCLYGACQRGKKNQPVPSVHCPK